MKIAIIGGGASGFFTAINTKLRNPNYEVIIIEKTHKVLSKVRISGGGRCNVTNIEPSPSLFIKSYARGDKYFKKVYQNFKNTEIITWFKKRGVELKAEEDGRVFPVSNNSQTIIECFLNACTEMGIEILYNSNCTSIEKNENGFSIEMNHNMICEVDKVVLCIGGGNNTNHYALVKKLGHRILEPLPSLFTFNLVDKKICSLMGLVAKNVNVKILTSTFEHSGDLLITHWGFSGPAIIKLSAYAAQFLHSKDYIYEVRVNWVNIQNDQEVKKELLHYKEKNHLKFIAKNPLFGLPSRLWEYLCLDAEISDAKKWDEISTKSLNRLVNLLTNSTFKAKGKTTFKEEFVTCGGVDLEEIHMESMQSKILPDLYFAGEVVNIDGVTGGFNFQNAWSTGFAISQNI